MKTNQKLLGKYNEMLIIIRHYCINKEPFTPKHITRAFKTNDSIITMMVRKEYITQLTNGRAKLYQWNRGAVTEALVHDFYQDVIEYQREYLQKKHLDKKLEMTNRVNEKLVLFEDSERKNNPKKRRKITILWGLITF